MRTKTKTKTKTKTNKMKHKGLDFALEGNTIKLNTTSNALLSAFLAKPKFSSRYSTSTRLFDEYSSDKRVAFCGGSMADLSSAAKGQRDISGVLEQKAALAKSGALKALNTGMATTNRRRRVMSDLDGEWDMDRRWDIAPFFATQKQPMPVRALKLIAHFGANCTASAKNLDKYGAFLAALVEIIESRGVTVDLVCRIKARQVTGASRKTVQADIQVKKCGEYISTQKLATVFWTNYFRRAVFFALMAASEFVGEDVCSSLGKADHSDKVVKASSGVLEISPSTDGRSLPDPELVIEKIKTALMA